MIIGIEKQKETKMKLYRIESVDGMTYKEIYITSFTSEKSAFEYMTGLEEHMVNSGYQVKSKDLDHLIVEKNAYGTTLYKRYELE